MQTATHPWIIPLTLLYLWGCPVAIAYMCGRIWWTAVRTGRWLLGGGRSYYFPSKYYTFSLYDRTNNPFMYRLSLISVPALFLFFLAIALLVSIGLVKG